jgi:hypothetical protein
MMGNIKQEILDVLPEEMLEELKRKEEERLERLESFGRSLSNKRQEAITGREGSGIETIWTEDEDAYEGFDEANGASTPDKPRSTTGDSSYRGRAKGVTRSTVYLNITRPYVDAAAAKISDMLLPTDDKNWGIKPTPIPSTGKNKTGDMPVMGLDGLQMQAELENPDGTMTKKPMTVDDFFKQSMQEAREKAERAERRIEDWLVECQYHAEVRKVIEDSSRIGTGILKGPVPIKRRTKVVKKDEETKTVTIEIEEKIAPDSKRVDPWNFYPDPTCGDCIHNGNYVFERDEITGKQLKALIGVPGYDESQIMKVLEEGPGKKLANRLGKRNASVDNERFEIWYYYGEVDLDDLRTVYKKADDEYSEKISAIVTMVNDTVIKGALNPLDSGEYPYDVMVWQRKSNDWTGIGVARQMRTPQRMLNAATRNMMDNAGLSAGPQLILRKNIITPADGTWEIVPRKIWLASEEADNRSVGDALTTINIPTMQGELMGIIQFAQKMAEDVTGLPALMQGQQGAAPETVGGMTMLLNNASTVLKRIARTFDDLITEPHIRRYYEWLMLYGEDDEKGDCLIDARGSTALVERDIQNQALLQLGNFLADPEFGIDKRKWFMEMAKAQRLDPNKFTYSDDEIEARMQQMAQQPQQQDPRVVAAQASIQTAQIRAESDIEKENIQSQTDMAELEFKRETMQMDNKARREEIAMQREIKIMELSQAQNLSITQIKAQLADTAMKERSKQKLQADEIAVKQQVGSGI